MATNVFVHDDVVDIDFTGWNRVWALKGHVELAMRHIVDARVAPRGEVAREHWAGASAAPAGPGKVTAGHYTTRGRKGVRQLWDVYTDDEVLVIETDLDRPWRVVLQHPDREFLAWVISERIHRPEPAVGIGRRREGWPAMDWTVLGWSALAIAAVMVATWVVSLPLRNASIVDPVWRLGFVVVAWVAGLPASPPAATACQWRAGRHGHGLGPAPRRSTCSGATTATARTSATSRCARSTATASG